MLDIQTFPNLEIELQEKWNNNKLLVVSKPRETQLPQGPGGICFLCMKNFTKILHRIGTLIA